MDKANALWTRVSWLDETNIELYGSNDRWYVWTSNAEVFKPENTGGGSIMLWGCLFVMLVRYTKRMEDYLRIRIRKTARQLKLGHNWMFWNG